jgi:hypothetical protein
MWECPKCGRIFKKRKQAHSCRRVPIEQHFKGKEHAKNIFEYLLGKIETEIGDIKIVSLPCCIHLFGQYDFVAALPKKDRLEIRFVLDRPIKETGIKRTVKMSSVAYKHVVDINSNDDVNKDLLNWINISYHLKG